MCPPQPGSSTSRPHLRHELQHLLLNSAGPLAVLEHRPAHHRPPAQPGLRHKAPANDPPWLSGLSSSTVPVRPSRARTYPTPRKPLMQVPSIPRRSPLHRRDRPLCQIFSLKPKCCGSLQDISHYHYGGP